MLSGILSPFLLIAELCKREYWTGCFIFAAILFFAPGIRAVVDGRLNTDEEFDVRLYSFYGLILAAIVFVISLVNMVLSPRVPELLIVEIFSSVIFLGVLTLGDK